MLEIHQPPATTVIDGTEYALHLATITETFLGVEDHGIATATMRVLYNDGGGTQTIGGYTLDDKPTEHGVDGRRRRRGIAYGMEHVLLTIDAIVGASGSWEQLKGSRLYVLKDKDAMGMSSPAKGVTAVNGERPVFLYDSLKWMLDAC